MLLNFREQIAYCNAQASSARLCAQTATDSKIKQEYRDLERRWTSLADCYRYVEAAESDIHRQKARVASI